MRFRGRRRKKRNRRDSSRLSSGNDPTTGETVDEPHGCIRGMHACEARTSPRMTSGDTDDDLVQAPGALAPTLAPRPPLEPGGPGRPAPPGGDRAANEPGVRPAGRGPAPRPQPGQPLGDL